MSTTHESEFPEPNPMTVDPANLGSVDPSSVEGLFLVALSKAGIERENFLSAQCVDQSQRQRVEALLVAYEKAGDFLQKPAVTAEPTPIGQYLAPCELPGTLGRLGPYEILEEIGRGGMGVVFRAHDPKLQRIVAVKALAPELARLPSARQRFLREARAAAAISHPHVVTIFAVEGTEEAALGTERTTLPFLVMECIVGQTLHDKIKRVGALKVEEIVRISRQIAEGLTAAHKRGLIHRDIKPANILLENGVERVKITDFGLARTTSDGGITHTGEILGTPQCMSPEQSHGEIVDQRSDLFSLGCVMYTMCTGVSPFRADNMLAVMKKVCEVTPRPIAQINPNLPEWLCELVHRLLEKEPEQRVQTAGNVVETLENHSLRLGIRTDRSAPVAESPTPRPKVAAGLNLWQRAQWQHCLLLVMLMSGLIGFMGGQNRYSYMLLLPVWGTAAWAVLFLAKLWLKIDWSWINWRSALGSVVALFCGANLRAWMISGYSRSNSVTASENFLRENSGLFVFPLAIGIFWLLTRLMPWGFISPHPPATQPLVNQSPAAPSRSPWSVLGWMLVGLFGIGLVGGLVLATAVIVYSLQSKQTPPAELSRVVLDTHGEKIAKLTVDGEEIRLRERDVDASGRQWFMDYVGPRTLHIEYRPDNPQEEKFYHSTVTINPNTTVINAAPSTRQVGSGPTAPAQPADAMNPSSPDVLAKLQGEWLVTDGFHHVQGSDVQFDDEFELLTRPGSKRSFVIRNDQIWHRVEFNRKDTDEPYRMDIPWGKIVLHADGNRHAIDLINENDQPPETRGLYQIDGDRLQLAIAVDSKTNSTKGMPRPKALLPGKDVIYFECARRGATESHSNPDTTSSRTGDQESEVLAKLQGKWHLTIRGPGPTAISNPNAYEAEAVVEGQLMTVFFTKELDASTPSDRFLAHTIKIQMGEQDTPPKIDLLFGPNEEKENRFLALGIVEITEDVIRLCFDRSTNSSLESSRPEVFAVGAKAAIWELRRTPPADSKAGMLARLQGRWSAEFVPDASGATPAELAEYPNIVFEISGNVAKTSFATPHPDEAELAVFSLQFGEPGKPQPIDLLWKTASDPEGDELHGIIEFSGEEVLVCFGDVKDRPQVLAAVKDSIYLVRLKRPPRAAE